MDVGIRMRKKVIEMLQDIIDVLGDGSDAELTRRLELIEKRLDALEQPKITINPPQWTQSPWATSCPTGGAHEYPSPWWGVNHPPCIKCGQTPNSTVITWTETSSDIKLKS